MIIKWTKPRAISFPKVANKSVTLVPGINIIDQTTWEQLRGYVADKIADGSLVEVAAKVAEVEAHKGPGGKEIKAETKVEAKDPWQLEPKEATALAESVNSPLVIQQWLDKDGREGVRAALYRRLTELEKDTAKA